MEERPHALLLKYPGTNCDAETARALQLVGFRTDVVPISLMTPDRLADADLVVLSGGFSYGDYVMAGRIAQLVTEHKLGKSLKRFHANGGYILGICNGFQILTKLGLLPEGSLIHNSSGRFQCHWVKLRKQAEESPYLKYLPGEFEFPVANAEGRFVTSTPEQAEKYLEDDLVALTYAGDKVNGSFSRIAGLQDSTGRVLGLMPHPERFIHRRHHYDPDWNPGKEWGWGYYFFKSIYESVTAAKAAAVA